jgi:GNAT superfamily N-acetyltransferase
MHSLAARTLYRLGRARLFRFFARTLGPEQRPAASGVAQLKWLEPGELRSLAGDPSLGLSGPKIDAAFARGDVCVGAYVDARLAGYCWFATAALPHLDDVWVDYSPQTLWIYKSLVLPPYRGRAIAGQLYASAEGRSRETGRRQTVICVEAHNAPSVAAALRAAHAPAGYAAYQLSGARLRTWYSGAVKPYGVRFFRPPEA